MRILLALALPLLSCCGPDLSEPDPSAGAGPKLSFEPSAEPSAVSGVVRIRVESASLEAGEVMLFQGALSSYYLARVKTGELPDTLAARQIPVVSWRESGQLSVAPAHPLAPGGYSLAARTGLVGQFQVESTLPLLTRWWPPASGAGALSYVVYCGDGSAPLEPSALAFEPGGLALTPLPGVDAGGSFADRCFHLAAPSALGAGEIVVPPPTVGAWALDPAPFVGAEAAPASALLCAEAEVPIGLGCARVEDDRLTVRTPDAALFWTVHTARGSVLEVTRASATFLVRGLSPDSSERVWGSSWDPAGVEREFDTVLYTSPARERPVLNEVLANPIGPEPQSEWIELVNDGALPLELSHFALRDSGGSIALPSAVLAAHEYALVTREDFAPSVSDVPPAPGTRLLRVAVLATAGLSNSGEGLALVDGDSVVVSALPAQAAKAGQSLARRHPYDSDDDPSAFTTGPPTPGAPNDSH